MSHPYITRDQQREEYESHRAYCLMRAGHETRTGHPERARTWRALAETYAEWMIHPPNRYFSKSA